MAYMDYIDLVVRSPKRPLNLLISLTYSSLWWNSFAGKMYCLYWNGSSGYNYSEMYSTLGVAVIYSVLCYIEHFCNGSWHYYVLDLPYWFKCLIVTSFGVVFANKLSKVNFMMVLISIINYSEGHNVSDGTSVQNESVSFCNEFCGWLLSLILLHFTQ